MVPEIFFYPVVVEQSIIDIKKKYDIGRLHRTSFGDARSPIHRETGSSPWGSIGPFPADELWLIKAILMGIVGIFDDLIF